MNEKAVESLFGTNAGIIWKTLNQNGSSNLSDLVKITSLSREEVYGALGWLGREDKIAAEQKGRAIVFSLRDEEARLVVPEETTTADSTPKAKSKRRKSKLPKKTKNARSVKSSASTPEVMKKALDFILSEFDANQEPTPTQVSKAVGMGKRQLGKALSMLEIKSESVRRGGKSVRIYPLACKARAWELAALDTEGLQKMVEAKAEALENDKEKSKAKFTVFD
jgi:hypothetical protein